MNIITHFLYMKKLRLREVPSVMYTTKYNQYVKYCHRNGTK